MSVAFDRGRTTVDIDARVDSGREKLMEAVEAVGRRHGFQEGWFSEPLAVVLPRGSDQRAGTLYQSQHLTVTGASAKHMLAMKLLAGRLKDRGDIAVLCKELGLVNERQAIRIKDEVFPGAAAQPAGARGVGEGVPGTRPGVRAVDDTLKAGSRLARLGHACANRRR